MPIINGEPPALDGVVLEALVCIEHWPDGIFEDAANEVYFRIRGLWHRLYFDFGTVFWRQDVDGLPDYPVPVTADAPFVIVDLAAKLLLTGRTIESCNTESVGQFDSKVSFRFAGGGTLSFTCVGDTTSVQHSGLPDA